jgi:uncharacterized protein YidB (DUF937 family)
MGLLGDILGKLTGGGTSQNAVVDVIGSLLQSKEMGGLDGLVQKFTKGGLGDIVSSWVSTGANLPISPEQIQKGLGPTQLSQMASQLGISPDAVSKQLSKILPGVVDKLTPDGKVPAQDLLSQGLNMLKGKL